MDASVRLTHAVVGCNDLDLTARFLGGLGFNETVSERIPADLAAALYGLGGPADTLKLSKPGVALGWIRLVESRGESQSWQPYRAGPVCLEIFTLTLEEAVALARDAGARLAATIHAPSPLPWSPWQQG